MRRLRAKKKVQAEEQVDQDEAEVGPSESIEVEGEDKEDKDSLWRYPRSYQVHKSGVYFTLGGRG